jgi:toxin ParE1/3/4
MLSARPEVGTVCEKLAPHLRFFPVGNYLIFYRAIPDGIEVICVLHGARELSDEFE